MDLKDILNYEKSRYFHNKKDYLKNKLLNSETYYIWRFICVLRKEEYYKKRVKNNKLLVPLWVLARKKRNKLGIKLGFDIPCGVLGVGVRIFHPGNIVVNPYAFIGDNTKLVGNICIGNQHGELKAPQIGKNCLLGWGCTIIGDSNIGDNCTVGAHALVVNTTCGNESILIGCPAKVNRNNMTGNNDE